jgi:[ribosomal protein S5]-alanine N-acetyltransferase
MVEIRTERLLLRPATAEDLMPLNAILSHKQATAFWSTPPHRDVEQTRDWLQSMIDIRAEEGEDFILEHEGRVIGKAGLYRFPEIGFILHPDYWGRGLAAEALRAVLDRAFEVHRLASVEADVDPRNAASLGLLGRLGFEKTGRKKRTWRIDGRWCDSVYLRLGAENWPPTSGA